MSRGKLYVMVGSLGVMVVVAAVALTLVFSRGGSSPAGSSPGPVASAVGLAQASGETVTSVDGPAKDVLAVAPAPDVSLAAAAAPAPSGGPSEGIKVHGHWTIEVREPDGTLVSRTEFQNALNPAGKATLVNFLGRVNSVGSWRILVDGVPNTSSLCFAPGTSTATTCFIVEAASSYTGANVFKNLVLGGTTFDLNIVSPFQLSGNFTAQKGGNVGSVGTSVDVCSNTVLSSATCTPTLGTPNVTGTTLTTPVSVVSGQQVLITVNISFS